MLLLIWWYNFLIVGPTFGLWYDFICWSNFWSVDLTFGLLITLFNHCEGWTPCLVFYFCIKGENKIQITIPLIGLWCYIYFSLDSNEVNALFFFLAMLYILFLSPDLNIFKMTIIVDCEIMQENIKDINWFDVLGVNLVRMLFCLCVSMSQSGWAPAQSLLVHHMLFIKLLIY